MSLASAIASRTRVPTATLKLNGRRVPGVLTISKTEEFGQGLASVTVVLRSPPDTPTPGMPISVTWGYNGFEVPGFTGYVITPERSSYPKTWTLQCADVLWLAQREEQVIVTSPLNSITATAAIAYILATYAGITRVSIPTISLTSGGPAWTLGTLTPVRWERSTALAACQEIAATAGYWLYADAGGTVRARLMERRPSDSPFRTLTGGDAAGATLLVAGAPVRRQPGDQVRNRITVRGANTGVEGAQLYDIYLATHALYPGVVADLEYASFLLEVIGDVTNVAERLAGLWNRRPNIVTARIKADPRLSVGTTVAIQDSDLGYVSAQPFFIYRIATTFDVRSGRFDQDLTLDGGTGDAGYSQVPAPVAVLSVAIEYETLDGTAVALLTLDGSGSYSQSGGVIVSWQFSTSDTVYTGTPTGSSSPHASPTFALVFPRTPSPIDVTLTVTDTTSKTDTITIAVDLAGEGASVPTSETVSVAFGAAWQVTPNGGDTWYTETASGDATRVPPIGAGVDDLAVVTDAATYGLLATRASGSTGIRRTLDGLATASTNLAALGGQITALSVNVRNASRVWAAVGDTVYRSLDGGTTFSAYGTPAAGVNVRDIIEDPALNDSVFCLAGADMYQALGSPVWSVFYVGPAGATARWLLRSRSGAITWICYSGTFSGSPLHRVEGPISVTFPVVSPVVSEIRAIAMNDALNPGAPALTAIDQEGRIWTLDALTGGDVTQSTQTLPAGGIAQHAQASYQAPLVYVADFDSVAVGTGAVRKYVPAIDRLLLFREGDAGQQAHMVGLGSAAVVAEFRLLLITTGVAAGSGGAYEYDSGTWTLRSTGLPNAVLYGEYIAANPSNPNQWIALFHQNASRALDLSGGQVVSQGSTDSPWWLWDGTTWNEIVVTAASLPSGAAAFMVEWTTDGRWILGWQSGSVDHTTIVTGTGTTPGATATTSDWSAPWFGAGQSGEVIVCQNFKTGGSFASDFIHVLNAAGTSFSTPAGSSPGDFGNPIPEREPAGRGLAFGTDALGATGAAYYAASDYGTAQPVGRGLDDIVTVTWATHGLYVAGPGGGVIVFSRITNPLSGTAAFESVAADYFGTTEIQWVRADRQTRSIVGVVSNEDRCFVWDGSVAAMIPMPIDEASLANRLEVLVG